MNSDMLAYWYAKIDMHTSKLLQTLAYWYAGGNNMNSATLVYKYAVRTGMQ